MPTFRQIVEAFIRQCGRCTVKLKKGVVRPITAKDFNERPQIDLVDFQLLPDGTYRYVLYNQDHLTKYHLLRPLTSNSAIEVANILLHTIKIPPAAETMIKFF